VRETAGSLILNVAHALYSRKIFRINTKYDKQKIEESYIIYEYSAIIVDLERGVTYEKNSTNK
jgi:hypothetical protein